MAKQQQYTLWFNPSSDITAFELASILLTMPLNKGGKALGVTGITATEDEWKRVPPPLRRFFTKDGLGQEVEVMGKPQVLVPEHAAPPPPPQFVVPEQSSPKGPSKQPDKPIPSFYHNEGVESLLPEGMAVGPAPDNS